MKKLITILALAIAVPSMVKAQGTINFSSTSANHVIRQNGVAVAPGFASVALYWGATSDSLSIIGAVVQNSAGGGVVGGLRTTGVATAGGSPAFFEVRAWTGGFATFELAVASGSGFAGVSGVFSNPTGNPNGIPPTPPANLTGWTVPVALVPVPEPSTIALGILGAGSLLFLRRKK